MPEPVFITGTPKNRKVYYGGKPLSPKPSQKLWNHSPDGFAWGYAGSGPAQLALAILYEHTGDAELSLQAYQTFKFDVITPLDGDLPFSIPESKVRQWLAGWPNDKRNPRR